MNKLILFVLLLLTTISFTGCNKWQHRYPEDTERTKLTPPERLTNKWWTLQSASVNGVDYTDSVFQLFGKYQIYFSLDLENVTVNGLHIYTGTVHTDNEPTFTSVWSFPDDASIGIGDLNGTFSNKQSVVPGYIHAPLLKYTILKLSKSEFKISLFWGNGYTVYNNFISN